MAKIVQLVCDWDEKTEFEPGKGGIEDFKFEADGNWYVIDLSTKGKAAFDAIQDEAESIRAEAEKRIAELYGQFTSKARPAPMSQAEKMRQTRTFYNKVKAWCDENKIKYNTQGKIRDEFIVRWERETGQARPDFVPYKY